MSICRGYWRESAIASAPAHIVVAKEPIVASVPGEASNESTPSIGGPSSVFTHSDDGHPRRLSLVDNLSIEASNLSTTAKVSLDSAVQAAATARTTAASHATAASGWLSRNLTCKNVFPPLWGTACIIDSNRLLYFQRKFLGSKQL